MAKNKNLKKKKQKKNFFFLEIYLFEANQKFEITASNPIQNKITEIQKNENFISKLRLIFSKGPTLIIIS